MPGVIHNEGMSRPTPEQVVRGIRRLPSAPKVVPRLYHLLYDGNSSLHEISSLVRLDPSLTSLVLQLGNRLGAERGEYCHSVESAINRAGFNRIHSLVFSAVDEQVLARPLSVYGYDMDEFWRLSLSCAISAEILAERTGEDMSMAYTAGLLHGVGMFAIDDWATGHETNLMFAPKMLPREFVDSERALLGFTQAEAGAALLRSWGFPSILVEALRWQYAPLCSAGYARMASLVHTAKWLRSVVCAEEGDVPPPFPESRILLPLRLSTEALGKCVVDVRVRLGEARNLVEAEVAA